MASWKPHKKRVGSGTGPVISGMISGSGSEWTKMLRIHNFWLSSRGWHPLWLLRTLLLSWKIRKITHKLKTNMNVVFVQEQLSGTQSTAAKGRSWTLSAKRAGWSASCGPTTAVSPSRCAMSWATQRGPPTVYSPPPSGPSPPGTSRPSSKEFTRWPPELVQIQQNPYRYPLCHLSLW